MSLTLVVVSPLISISLQGVLRHLHLYSPVTNARGSIFTYFHPSQRILVVFSPIFTHHYLDLGGIFTYHHPPQMSVVAPSLIFTRP